VYIFFFRFFFSTEFRLSALRRRLIGISKNRVCTAASRAVRENNNKHKYYRWCEHGDDARPVHKNIANYSFDRYKTLFTAILFYGHRCCTIPIQMAVAMEPLELQQLQYIYSDRETQPSTAENACTVFRFFNFCHYCGCMHLPPTHTRVYNVL